MKPKYSIGEIVRIKETGEKVRIDDVREWDSETIYWIKAKDYVHIWYVESELAPYRPSRTGKYRNEKGQFISQYESYKELLKGGDAKLYTGLYKNKLDSKQRNYQKKSTKFDISGFTGGINIKDLTPHIDNEQKILTTLERIEKKLDRLSGVTKYENV